MEGGVAAMDTEFGRTEKGIKSGLEDVWVDNSWSKVWKD